MYFEDVRGWTANDGLVDGATHYELRHMPGLKREAEDVWRWVRGFYGFTSRDVPPLTTEGDANSKWAGHDFIAGYTGQSHVNRFPARDGACEHWGIHVGRITVNFCPEAGFCVRDCVMKGNRQKMKLVQRARSARAEFETRAPYHWGFLLGYRLAHLYRVHGGFWYRPEANTDKVTEEQLPSLVNGELFNGDLALFGYSKLMERVLSSPQGWISPYFRVAYSLNERTDWSRMVPWLMDNGPVAAVTDRVKGQPVKQWFPGVQVIDADVDDTWMWHVKVPTIGDLSGKNNVADRPNEGFVQRIYQTKSIPVMAV
jgi:hypothetical protein